MKPLICRPTRFLPLLMLLAAVAIAVEPRAFQQTGTRFSRVSNLSKADLAAMNLEQEEIRYQLDVQQQTIADLAEIYSPEHADRLQIAYASFTPESSSKPGEDGGYGLHIVKRLELPLPAGQTRTIYVNEQWVEDKQSHGLFLPDEIRIKTQAAAGERRVKGSENLYLFDSIHVAWGPFNRELELARRTIYERTANGNEFKVTRNAVSTPFSCGSCHQPANRFADLFLARGEHHNYEAIVQDSQFTLPPERMRGFQQYIAYLERAGVAASTIQKTKDALSNPAVASTVPGLLGAIRAAAANGIRDWLSGDPAVPDGDIDGWKYHQGVYQDFSGRWRVDAVQDLVEGKYVWWEPIPVIP